MDLLGNESAFKEEYYPFLSPFLSILS